MGHNTLFLLVAAPGLLCLASCGSRVPQEQLPATFAVSGKVIGKDGKPVPAGAVEFRSPSYPNLTILGEIKPDGTFSLLTLGINTKAEGAPAGNYKVVVLLQPAVQPIDMPEEYNIQADVDNLVISLDKRK